MTIELQIVTHDGIQLKRDVTELTAPSVEGEFGVLPGHRPLLAALRTGIVSYRQGGEESRVAVGVGFVEVVDDRAMLLTDHFIEKQDVDPVRARLDLKEADEALDKFSGEPGSPEHVDLVQKEQWAATQLELYGDPPPPTIRGAEYEFQPVSAEVYRGAGEGPHLAEAEVAAEDARAAETK